jgi:N12 class adenine-specific DNA methylase
VREQIAAYDELLTDHVRADPSPAHRHLINAIEKHNARHEAHLHDLLARDKKDDGLVFDELGIDYHYVDEAHLFFNLESPT